MEVLIVASCLLLAGIHFLRKLSNSIQATGAQIANRTAAAVAGRTESQGVPLGGGGGGGMGAGGAGNHFKPMSIVSNANALDGVLLARALGMKSPLDPFARRRQDMELRQMHMYLEGAYSEGGAMDQNYLAQRFYQERAEISMRQFHGDGPDQRALFDAIDRIIDGGGNYANAYAALIAAGFDPGDGDSRRLHHAIQATVYRRGFGPKVWDGDPFVGEAITALRYAQRARVDPEVARVNVMQSGTRLRYAFPGDQGLSARISPAMPNGLDAREQAYVDSYLRDRNRDQLRGMVALYSNADPAAGNAPLPLPAALRGMGTDSGHRMLSYIQDHLITEYSEAAERRDLPAASRSLEQLAWSNFYSTSAKMSPARVIPHFD